MRGERRYSIGASKKAKELQSDVTALLPSPGMDHVQDFGLQNRCERIKGMSSRGILNFIASNPMCSLVFDIETDRTNVLGKETKYHKV